MIEEAEAYKVSVVLKAEGEVASFSKMLPEYQAAPEITRERLYIETMERVLSNTRKIIANEKSNSMLVLPLDQLMRGNNSASTPKVTQAPKVTYPNSNQSSLNTDPSSSAAVRGDAVRVGRQ